MKIIIPIVIVLLLIIAFLGFQVFSIIDREIEEMSISRIEPIDVNNNTLSVDTFENASSYTQRISTYPNVSDDILASVKKHLLTEMLTLYYFDNQALIAYETSENLSIEISGPCIILLKDADYKTNIPLTDYEILSTDDFILFKFTPSTTGNYFIDGQLIIEISVLEI